MTKSLTNRFVRSLACSAPAFLLAAPVDAQTTAQDVSPGDPAAGVEEVVVTGIRESLNRARDIKRKTAPST